MLLILLCHNLTIFQKHFFFNEAEISRVPFNAVMLFGNFSGLSPVRKLWLKLCIFPVGMCQSDLLLWISTDSLAWSFFILVVSRCLGSDVVGLNSLQNTIRIHTNLWSPASAMSKASLPDVTGCPWSVNEYKLCFRSHYFNHGKHKTWPKPLGLGPDAVLVNNAVVILIPALFTLTSLFFLP